MNTHVNPLIKLPRPLPSRPAEPRGLAPEALRRIAFAAAREVLG